MVAVDWQRVWSPELLLSSWLSASFMLMTASLLFYHMTRVSSLEMDPRVAGCFAIALIVISVSMCVTGTVTYSYRVRNSLDEAGDSEAEADAIKHEENYRTTHIALCAVLTFVDIGIALVIVRGSFMGGRRPTTGKGGL